MNPLGAAIRDTDQIRHANGVSVAWNKPCSLSYFLFRSSRDSLFSLRCSQQWLCRSLQRQPLVAEWLGI